MFRSALLEILVYDITIQNHLVSGFPTFDSASEALRLSAFDYLTKPVKKEELAQVINAAVKEKNLQPA